jgi:alpha-glucuronidase
MVSTDMMKLYKRVALATLLVLQTGVLLAEDGHQLWLRKPLATKFIQIAIDNPDIDLSSSQYQPIAIAREELDLYINSNFEIHLCLDASAPADDGFSITRSGNIILIRSASPQGLLYGSYHLIRLETIGKMLKNDESIVEHPTSKLRLLNHWDNLNGTIERGFAGHSIFWSSKGDIIDQNESLLIEYARANASIGINGTVLNNVNASPQMLTSERIGQASKIANLLAPFGIKVYLSVNFASPRALGDVSTADPLDPDVIRWWQNKVKEIYATIPNFGGFLVKANSEGEPGPQDFGRTHVDGANMLADALKPYGGIVMWRAFVYAANSPDRACQAYDEFMPFDGHFRDNVILQVKNGPVDFQPREPVHPLFYSMKHTKVMPEFQITQEYLGESVHSVFLAPMWKELTDVFKMYEGVAGVSNIGDSRNWCGSDMAQANWYAFGRLAWNQDLTSQEIADEWLKQTFTTNKKFLTPMTKVMLASHEACVKYMMPMGIHHIFAGGHHYGPEPWYAPRGLRADWTPPYYHKADEFGMGFDRTTKGSNNVSQYPEPLASQYNDINRCPEKYLLWFHHVGWTQQLPCGETLWDRLCHIYDEGVREAESFYTTWQKIGKYIDAERYQQLLIRYERQAKDAWWWRDACLLYFQTFSKQPFPKDCPPARHDLQTLMRYHLAIDNYTAAPIDQLP